MACFYGQIDLVNILLMHGANVHARNNEALYYACKNSHLHIVANLLACGADPSAIFSIPSSLDSANLFTPSTPLEAAIESGNMEIVHELLLAGADIHPDSDPALYIDAVFQGQSNTIKDIVIEYGEITDDDNINHALHINNTSAYLLLMGL